jgi:ribonuclease Z
MYGIMEAIFLGTSCMKPTRERNHPAIFLSYRNEGLLFDCGEGTQRQLRLANLKPARITKIFITHWHGDHVLGLPGLLQTMASEKSEENAGQVLEIYGPHGTKRFFDNMAKWLYYDARMEIAIKEVKGGKAFENKDFYVEALELEHKVPTLGYSFVEKDKRKINMAFAKKAGIPEGPLLGKLQEGKAIEWKGKKVTVEEATLPKKGKKMTYITDTLLCENCIRLAKDADILVCEAVYTDELKEKAHEYMHMTAKEAAQLANSAGVKKLVLTHFSQRYKTTEEVEKEAKDYFGEVVSSFDLMKINF